MVKLQTNVKSITYRLLPNGSVEIKKAEQYSDDNTDIQYARSIEPRDLTDAELNEIVDEMEQATMKTMDDLPLNAIRKAALGLYY